MHMATTPDPPAETPMPRQREDCGGANECNHYEVYGVLCVRHGGPADTPTGLAPLLVITQRRLDGLDFNVGLPSPSMSDEDRAIFWCDYATELNRELKAQRQASASARREAIEACVTIVDTCIRQTPRGEDDTPEYIAACLRQFLRDQS